MGKSKKKVDVSSLTPEQIEKRAKVLAYNHWKHDLEKAGKWKTREKFKAKLTRMQNEFVAEALKNAKKNGNGKETVAEQAALADVGTKVTEAMNNASKFSLVDLVSQLEQAEKARVTLKAKIIDLLK